MNVLDVYGWGMMFVFLNFFFVVDVGGDGEFCVVFGGLFNFFANGVGL